MTSTPAGPPTVRIALSTASTLGEVKTGPATAAVSALAHVAGMGGLMAGTAAGNDRNLAGGARVRSRREAPRFHPAAASAGDRQEPAFDHIIDDVRDR
jgi:hypothetical protein